MFSKCLKNERFLCFVGGIAAATLGVKALKSDKTRDLCVKGIAKGMKLQKDAQETFQNMKEEASDICFDAKQQTDSEE